MKSAAWHLVGALALSLFSAPALAQEGADEATTNSSPPSDQWADGELAEDPKLGTGVDRFLSTADQAVKPEFQIWKDDRLQSFIKPVIQMSSSMVFYTPQSEAEVSEFASRLSTLLLARIGFEGELFGFLTFRSVFERNLGFTIARNGPVGTSVWEGTASWQARENYIRLHKWGLSLTAGIVPDPASLDYISENILDNFGMDPFVRDPLLISGFNQGQSVLLRYELGDFAAGFGFTGGNPLVSSLSFGFGGEVNQFGTLFSAPLRALANGLPGSNIHLNLFSPSVMYEDDTFGLKLAGQFYVIDNDVTQEEDVELTGYNLRATGRLALLDGNLRFYATGAFRQNDRVQLPDTSELNEDSYRGVVAAGGFDFDFALLGIPRLGIGGNYYFVYQLLQEDFQDSGVDNDFTFHYINVGLTYWLWDDVVSSGFRWARLMSDSSVESLQPLFTAADSLILSLRLSI